MQPQEKQFSVLSPISPHHQQTSNLGDWFPERIAAWISRICTARQRVLIVLFSAIYFGGSGIVAASKPLWFDEIFTLEVAKLDFPNIWAALKSGLDVTPPLYNWITHVCVLAFGVNAFAIRLPSLIGCWVMAMCLFFLVSRRLPAIYGFIAMLCPFWTVARIYAFEARPYGLVLGLSAASLLLWQYAVETERARRIPIVALAICMLAGASIHFYFVLLLVPLALGEAVRTIHSRRIELPVWLAIFAGLLSLPLHATLVAGALSYSGDFWSRPNWHRVTACYSELIGELLLPGVVLLCTAVLAKVTPAIRHKPHDHSFKSHEVAALLGFIVLPVAAYLGAVFVTGIFVFRYAIIVVLGASVLMAFAAKATDRSALPAALLVLAFAGHFVLFETRRPAISLAENPIPQLLSNANGNDLPIVVADPLQYVKLTQYASPALGSRLYYIADLDLSNAYSGSVSADRGVLELQKWRRLNILPYQEFITRYPHFLVYSMRGEFEWLVTKLLDDRKKLSLQRKAANDELYEVTASPH